MPYLSIHLIIHMYYWSFGFSLPTLLYDGILPSSNSILFPFLFTFKLKHYFFGTFRLKNFVEHPHFTIFHEDNTNS